MDSIEPERAKEVNVTAFKTTNDITNDEVLSQDVEGDISPQSIVKRKEANINSETVNKSTEEVVSIADRVNNQINEVNITGRDTAKESRSYNKGKPLKSEKESRHSACDEKTFRKQKETIVAAR